MKATGASTTPFDFGCSGSTDDTESPLPTLVSVVRASSGSAKVLVAANMPSPRNSPTRIGMLRSGRGSMRNGSRQSRAPPVVPGFAPLPETLGSGAASRYSVRTARVHGSWSYIHRLIGLRGSSSSEVSDIGCPFERSVGAKRPREV